MNVIEICGSETSIAFTGDNNPPTENEIRGIINEMNGYIKTANKMSEKFVSDEITKLYPLQFVVLEDKADKIKNACFKLAKSFSSLSYAHPMRARLINIILDANDVYARAFEAIEKSRHKRID